MLFLKRIYDVIFKLIELLCWEIDKAGRTCLVTYLSKETSDRVLVLSSVGFLDEQEMFSLHWQFQQKLLTEVTRLFTPTLAIT